MKKRKYITIVNNLKKLLNKEGRGKDGTNSQENFLNLLKELKTNHGIEVSKDFLFNLMNKKKENKQKRQKIRDLLRGVVLDEFNKYTRELEFVQLRVDIKEYGINKWGEVCIKRKKNQSVGKEFIKPTKKTYSFVNLDIKQKC